VRKRLAIWLLRILGVWPIVGRVDRVVVGRFETVPSRLYATVYAHAWSPRVGMLGGTGSSGLHQCEEMQGKRDECAEGAD